MTPPANPDDAYVLSSILNFLTSMSRFSILPSSMVPTLISSTRRAQLFLLERGSREDMTTTVDWTELSSSITEFLSWFLMSLSQSDLVELVSNSSIVSGIDLTGNRLLYLYYTYFLLNDSATCRYYR